MKVVVIGHGLDSGLINELLNNECIIVSNTEELKDKWEELGKEMGSMYLLNEAIKEVTDNSNHRKKNKKVKNWNRNKFYQK